MKTSTIEKEENKRQTRKSRIENEEKKSKNKGKKKSKTKKRNIVSNIFTFLFSLGTVGIVLVLFLLYGPYSGFRNWLVTTAMTTMTHQYLATWFYDDDVIKYVMDNNKVIETGETTDANAITVRAGDSVKQGQVIGKSGTSGCSTGGHLHFEMRLNGTKVDPLDYVSPTEPRRVVKADNTVDKNSTRMEMEE